MAPQTPHSSVPALWALARRQHWVVSRAQLLGIGFGKEWIRHRIDKGRLHPIRRGVYAVGRPAVSQRGLWMAAVLSCGAQAFLSHESAAALWRIHLRPGGILEVSVSVPGDPRPPGIRVHRRKNLLPDDVGRRHNIPVTSPTRTLIDVAPRLAPDQLEAAVNEADKLDLVDPETLRAALDERPGERGVARLRTLLDRRTFTVTDSELERRFLRIAEKAGLSCPLTGESVSGFDVDFFWPELGLVVETDGLRYHRTPAQQARDRLRDQAHTASGLTPLRFTRAQVRFEQGYVEATLARVARRLRGAG